MSETTMKWYQFLLKETETDLFHTLRSIEQDGVPPTRNEVNKLRQTLDLLGYAGDQCLGRYHVDGSNLILECAKIGAVIRHKILGGDWDKRATHDADEDPADEPDAVLDTQPADTVGKAFSDDEPISWDDVKEEVIPSYVKTVTFTIAEAEITPSRRKELEERFPGVAIQVVSPALVSAKVGKPKGIKSATFELDRLELDNDPALQTSIGNQFPWATIRPEPVASISSSEAPVSATTTEPHISLHLAHDLPGHTKKGPVVRRESVDASSEATDTSPRPSPRNRSAIQRETPGRARPATGIVQAAADEDEQEDNRQSKLDESIQSVPKGPKGHESADETIKAVARQIGLEMAHPDVICGMYSQYSRTKQIRPFVPKLYKLDHYYSNLVDLSIIANKKRMAPLEYALLLKFQCTNYQYQRQIPEIPIAIKAFQYLPIRSPLCRWMTILYSFLWGTEDEGDYDAFCASYEGLDQAALARFLFGVARVRCPFTTGLDAAVLKRWCDVHSHAPGSEEERLCKETISKSKVSIDDATRDEERLRLKEAEATINELGGTVIMPPQGASTSGPGKRKYEGAANSRFSKKNKRGGGLGLGTLTSSIPADAAANLHPTPSPISRRSGGASPDPSILHLSSNGDYVQEESPPLTQLDNVPDHHLAALSYAPSARTKALYDHWLGKSSLPVHRNRKGLPARISTAYTSPSNQVYDELLDLMIYASNEGLKDGFEQAVLKKWQGTDFSSSYGFPTPSLRLVEKAFNNLPKHHSLLKYLVRFFSCCWLADDAVSIGEYEPRGPGFERFLYGVCWHRAISMGNLSDMLLWRWCEFHDHASEAEHRKCHEWRDSLVKKGWQKEWENSAKEQMEVNLTLKDMSVNRFPDVPQGKPKDTKERPLASSMVWDTKQTPDLRTAAQLGSQGQQNGVSAVVDLGSPMDTSGEEHVDSLYAGAAPAKATNEAPALEEAPASVLKVSDEATEDNGLPAIIDLANEDDDSSSDDSVASKRSINIGRGALRSAKAIAKRARTGDPSAIGKNTFKGHRARAIPRSGRIFNSSNAAEDDWSDDSAKAETNASASKPSRPLQRASVGAPRTPKKKQTANEDPELGTPERRSNRTSKSLPPGYFKEKPAQKDFGKTMWKGF